MLRRRVLGAKTSALYLGSRIVYACRGKGHPQIRRWRVVVVRSNQVSSIGRSPRTLWCLENDVHGVGQQRVIAFSANGKALPERQKLNITPGNVYCF